jgi:hypothetical protein
LEIYSGQELAPQYKKNLSIADRVMGQLLLIATRKDVFL